MIFFVSLSGNRAWLAMNTTDLFLIKAAGHVLQLFLTGLKILSIDSGVGAKQCRLVLMWQVELGKGFCGYTKYFIENSNQIMKKLLINSSHVY